MSQPKINLPNLAPWEVLIRHGHYATHSGCKKPGFIGRRPSNPNEDRTGMRLRLVCITCKRRVGRQAEACIQTGCVQSPEVYWGEDGAWVLHPCPQPEGEEPLPENPCVDPLAPGEFAFEQPTLSRGPGAPGSTLPVNSIIVETCGRLGILVPDFLYEMAQRNITADQLMAEKEEIAALHRTVAILDKAVDEAKAKVAGAKKKKARKVKNMWATNGNWFKS